jgi:hypothetical protein
MSDPILNDVLTPEEALKNNVIAFVLCWMRKLLKVFRG